MTRRISRRSASWLVALTAFFLVLSASAVDRTKLGKRPDRRSPSRQELDRRVRRPPLHRGLGYASDRVLVRFRPGTPEALVEGLLAAYGFRAARRVPAIGLYALQTPAGMGVAETLAVLRRNPYIDEARPDARTRLAVVPNDSYFVAYQYNLRNRGGILDISDDIRPQTKAGADIKAVTAWDETQGGPEVVIAVLDTGVDMTHPELSSKVVSAGRDFANDDLDATDDNWHGTHTAGVAAADTDNGQGIAGVAWNCRILPIKVTEADGFGYYSWLIDGLVWAADQGAKVANISLGGDEDDPFLEDACRYAFERGVVIVAAAGNEAGPVVYPAAYDPYVLAVAATDYNDERADFSNLGPEVDVAAPGVYILGPVPQWFVSPGALPYVFATGTSEAAPHVAGLAALLFSLKPRLTASDVMKIIRYTADDVNAASRRGRDDELGYGRINMTRALAPYILR